MLNKLMLEVSYRTGLFIEDTTICYVDYVSRHLDNNNSYVRPLFIDFSWAFNIIVHHIFLEKLLQLGVSVNLCKFIWDFLTEKEAICVRKWKYSTTLVINIGSPQCVLSAVLVILYTHGVIAKQDKCYIIKYADDTVITGLITDNNEEKYTREIYNVVRWCNEHNLLLNVQKPKELIFDFQIHQDNHR